MTAAIDVSGLNFNHGKTPILRDISLSVDKGSFYLIIGPNGSGKTTLMKILAGIEKKDSGKLNILDRPMASYSRKALARTIAFVPQTFSPEFPFRVEEMVLYGRSPHLGMLGMPGEKDLSTARKAMEFTGVSHLAGRRMDRLSGGEQQRVSIARAICQEAEVILLDEPTSALDLSHQVMIMDLMEKLKTEKKTTVVMVSHDINLAALYGDSLALLCEGKVTATGPPARVIDPSILEEVYGCSLLVDKSPFGEVPRISPVPGRFSSFTT